MDELLYIDDDKNVVITPYALAIVEFKAIWKRDYGSSVTNKLTGKNERVKNIATAEIAYIWFMENWKSPYQQSYKDVDLRREKVKTKVGLPEDWKEDKVVEAAREWYKNELEKTNIYIISLTASKHAVVEMAGFLREISLSGSSNRMNNGGARFKPKDITSAVKELGDIQESIKKMEDAVKREQKMQKNVRGGGSVGHYEE